MAGAYASLASEATGTVPAAAGAGHVLRFQDSNLQTFPPPHDIRGKMTSSFRPPHDAVETFSQPGPGAQGGQGWQNGQGGLGGQGGPSGPSQTWQGYFNVLSYRPYFNVDTVDVIDRIKDSLMVNVDFIEKTSYNPDMYGPFWICSTLIFFTASLGNFAAYLSYKSKTAGGHWHYDISLMSSAALLFYGYICLVPLSLYFLLRYLGVVSGLIQLWCLYGYSLFIFIPASLLSVVPWEIVRWVVVGVASFVSAIFVGGNIRAQIKTSSERWLAIVLGTVALHLALGLVLKLYFFTYFYQEAIKV
ncbi:hypothetical protein M758_4G180200 [Ceratodon purpureus]|uniref:Protein YIP n=1 Tax=Ceratodon purpureus TaxID=3225 RepID=A0A8T0IAR1_CERPU|nr:hypothetical protein KC19_4G178000 [Ceratodon purpureus]KAG0619993.1 hypothetical protein M758_4G180200 [Ceratodon purpureus]